MTHVSASDASRSRRRGAPAAWLDVLGLLPYTVLIVMFLLLPVAANAWRAVHNDAGQFTLDALTSIISGQYAGAFVNSINLSVVSAVIGGLLGLVLAWALTAVTRPAWLRNLLLSYSGVASQLGGIPLAYAFIALMGAQGLLTVALRDTTGISLNQIMPLSSFWGLVTVYLYFQVPLMAVLMFPSIATMKESWRESALTLGASRLHYLRTVAVPILTPVTLATVLLLFANAFSAYATAYVLSGGSANLVPIHIGFAISSNVFVDRSLGAALATAMILIVLLVLGLRTALIRRTERWLA